MVQLNITNITHIHLMNIHVITKMIIRNRRKKNIVNESWNQFPLLLLSWSSSLLSTTSLSRQFYFMAIRYWTTLKFTLATALLIDLVGWLFISTLPTVEEYQDLGYCDNYFMRHILTTFNAHFCYSSLHWMNNIQYMYIDWQQPWSGDDRQTTNETTDTPHISAICMSR